MRLLLVRPDHLGDVLLALPAAVSLRRALPTAHISFLVSSGLEEIPARCPEVEEVRSLPFPPPDAPPSPPGWSHVVAGAAPDLRFDAAVVLRPSDPWSGALLASAGVPIRIGYDQPASVPFLTDVVPEPDGVHAVTLAVRLAQATAARLGAPIPREPSGPRIVPSHDDVREVERLAAGLLWGGGRPIVLHPGSGWPLKNWPPERWAAVARRVASLHGGPCLVAGADSERAIVERVACLAGPHAVPVVGMRLGALAALHQRACLVVATDSGAAHLAAAVGTPVVALFGPGDPALARPWCPPARARLVRIDLPCSPCGVLHEPPCGASVMSACITGIGVEEVLRAISELSATQGEDGCRSSASVRAPGGG
ncbi:MAG: glycosyltransferase family 9 protein [Actinomycetota bacterium]|nr:glycosyltransferase family 9 protein [Actinomycetota bacterium]